MGDPFSVAGTAVGITSLGIQLCQIVSRYYSQYRGIHDEINDVVDRTNALEAYLKSLARLKQKIETDDDVLSAELQQALQTCEEVLARLKEMAKRCGETNAPDSLADRMRMARKRLLWPFRRDTLMDLQTTLDRFQSNLGLALQLLGLDYEVDQLRTLVAETKEIHMEIKDMSIVQIAQATQLNTSISSLSNQLALTHITASDGLNTISAAQQSHNTMVQAGFDDLSNQYERLLKQSTAMQKILENLVPADSISHPTGTPLLPNIITNEQASKALRTRFNRSLRQYNANIPRNQNRNTSELMGCLCRNTASQKMSTRVRKWITFYSESAYEHAPGCPHFSHSDFSKNVGVRFNMCNFLIRKCVHAGFQQSRLQGWSTISPFLRCRAIVPSNSGVFKVIADARKIACDRRITGKIVRQAEVEEILSNLMNAMRYCFSKNAHPTDINELGESILESIMLLLRKFVLEEWIEDSAMIFNFLVACHKLSLFTTDAAGALTLWQRSVAMRSTNIALEIFCFLAKRLDNWRLEIAFFGHGEGRLICDTVATMLVAEDIITGLLEIDCLHGAILRRSESDFQTCIETNDSRYLTSVLTRLEYIVPLICWSAGLKLLISSGSVNDVKSIRTWLWKAAIFYLHVESIQLLIDSQWEVSMKEWFSLNMETHWAFQENDVNLSERKNPERYRHIFQSLATKLSKQLELDGSIDSSSGIALQGRREIPFYHTPFLHVTTAANLWNAGYRNIDTIHPDVHKENTNETPLWMIASGFRYYKEWNHFWPVASWLIDKGANAFWSHPFFVTTPAHILVRKAVQSAIHHKALEDLQSTSDLLRSSQTDKCSCYCSPSGCYPVSCAVSEYSSRRQLELWEDSMRATQELFCKECCLPWLLSILDQERNSKGMVTAVIRRITFEELSLTHTCCTRIQLREYEPRMYTPLEKNEVEEIHETEKEDMILLDELMEEFEMEWHSHSGTFAAFIKQVWKPRMKALRAEQKDLHEIFQETGIKLFVSESNSSELRFLEISDGSEDEEEEYYDVNSDIEEA